MYVKQRLKKIEEKVSPRSKSRLWIVSESYNIPSKPEDEKSSQAVKKRIADIKAGKIEHRDGGHYERGDTIYIISRIFTDIKPDESSKPSRIKPISEEPESTEEKIQELKDRKQDLENEEKIKVLKKRKRDLEREIKEGKE